MNAAPRTPAATAPRVAARDGLWSSAPARDLERFLGDPHDGNREFSFARSLALDEREAFPARICAELEEWGLQRYYVPAAHGGELTDYDGALQLMRVLARRDLTVAIGHGKTYLGGVCAWVGADDAQAAALGERIRAGAVVSLALTERAHGSDLLAGEVSATAAAGGLRVTGEKWLINNATRGELLCLLAATDDQRGARGFDVLLVDKHELPDGSYRHLPKVRTHGIRGADISGIAFDGAPVDAASAIGEPGTGIETVLKALQVTRTMCTSLSLGAGDTALRVATAFVAERELYGRALVGFPHARRELATAYADLLVAEAVGLVAARSLQALPAEASVSSAVAKYLVPRTVDGVMARLARLLGARAYLQDVHAHGLFQKIERDQRIVGLFDGNTLVNLHTIVNQGPLLARAHRRGVAPAAGAAAAFDLDAPLDPFDPARLALVARAGASPLLGLADAVARLDGLAAEAPELETAVALAARLSRISADVHAELAEQRHRVDAIPAASFVLAERYCLCYAAACCIQLWLANRASEAASAVWHEALWLRAALRRLVERLEPEAASAEPGPPAETDALVDALLAQAGASQMLSLFAFALEDGRW